MKRIALFLVTLLCLSACGSKQQQSGKETLTVTLEPLRYFTEVIAGDKYNVVSMVPKPGDLRPYSATVGQSGQKYCLLTHRLHWIRTSMDG